MNQVNDIGRWRCADVPFSRNSSIPLVLIFDRVEEQTDYSCGISLLGASDMETIGRQASFECDPVGALAVLRLRLDEGARLNLQPEQGVIGRRR